MHPSDLNKPPSKKELAGLEKFLATTPGAMSLARAHGLMTAVASAPGMVMPSDWFPRIANDAKFSSQGQAQEIFGTALRLFNETLKDLNAGKPTILGDDRRQWCVGYIAGVDLDPEWMNDDDARQQIAVIMIVAENKVPKKIKQPEGFLAACRNDLEQFVLEIYKHFTDLRRKETEVQRAPSATQMGSAASKAGRNEPCPCGSGKKFKKCHGFN